MKVSQVHKCKAQYMKLKLIIILFLCSISLVAFTTYKPITSKSSTGYTDPVKKNEAFSYTDGFILGTIQGLTEYLPVSSTGHLIIANHFLNLDRNAPILDNDNNIIYQTNLKTGQKEPYTLQMAANAYVIIIQGGTLLAVIMIFWNHVKEISLGCLGRCARGLFLARNLITALIPTGLAGLLVDDYVDTHLYTLKNVMIALALGSLLMFFAEWWRKKRSSVIEILDLQLHQLSLLQCLFIGTMQALALWPGTSRSMITIIACYFVGLKPARAAGFSFLLGFITISSATGYKIIKAGPSMIQGLSLSPSFFGCLVSLIVAILAIKWFIQYITNHGLALFAWYRLLLAGVLFLIFNAAS